MPFVNGKFYMNPAYGRAVEGARDAESSPGQPDRNGRGDHWVTINGHHVLIHEAHGREARRAQLGSRHLSARDQAYLDKYYGPVTTLAKQFGVDPALVLGLGMESGFAMKGTYLRTGDAFGMTGGSTKHMTTAKSPAQNVHQFFANYGAQIRGTGSNVSAFINALQGRDASGNRVPGWRVYNSDRPTAWELMARKGIHQMQQEVPSYSSEAAR